MTVKKVHRTNLRRSFFVGVIGVASVLGMVSVGFASWSFVDTQTSFYIGADAEDVIVTTMSQGLGTFGINVDDISTVSVDHFRYAVRGENTDTTFADDDYIDVYGDLNIHTGMSVNLNISGTGDNINSIGFDDKDYTYLKIDMEFHTDNFINIKYNNAILTLRNLPQYYLEPEMTNVTFGVTYYDFYIPVKSSTKMSLYSLALIDKTATSGDIPLDLDISFDLSNNGYTNNKNIPTEIKVVYTLISAADYESDMSSGGGHLDEDEN